MAGLPPIHHDKDAVVKHIVDNARNKLDPFETKEPDALIGSIVHLHHGTGSIETSSFTFITGSNNGPRTLNIFGANPITSDAPLLLHIVH